MKNYIFITVAFSLVFTFQSMAQRGDAQRNQLQGPAAKNYKPWKDAFASTKTIMVKQPMEFKGPAAKNYKPWKEDCELSPMVFEERRALKGPKAKNQQYTTRTKYLSDSVSTL